LQIVGAQAGCTLRPEVIVGLLPNVVEANHRLAILQWQPMAYPQMSDAKRPNQQSAFVVAYDPTWPQLFERLKAPIWEAVQGIAESVEHVGSTSVPGLAAKPIIDMDIVVAKRADVPLVIERLARLGYVHVGDLGIEDREAFQNPHDSPRHHLYVCVRGAMALENHLKVRDYLRSHPEEAKLYGELKMRLADQYRYDLARYVVGKTDFIVGILAKAGCSNTQLHTVRRANSDQNESGG
jgi:GrpB-like predicted nucleotidyltransferase (UPF0157 family)